MGDGIEAGDEDSDQLTETGEVQFNHNSHNKFQSEG